MPSQEMRITFGGWYQRTTLHLTELYDFMANQHSKLELSKEKLDHLHHNLNLKSIGREVDYLEFIRAVTNDGIEIRYYEDGLYVFELLSGDLDHATLKLTAYFEECFSPAISYLFSLGAPTPKILADIKPVHPIVVCVTTSHPSKFVPDKKYGSVYSQLDSKDISVYKTVNFIFIATKPNLEKTVGDLVEMQIFFREFKDQLARYLDIHRRVWEKIAAIKDRRDLRGRDVDIVRAELDSYQKTINLISNRINQMDSYIKTRSKASSELGVENHLNALFQYKFEVLSDTLDYIKEIWKMTSDYLNSAIETVGQITNRITSSNISSLRAITTIGVVTSVVGYLSIQKFPQISSFGLMYFLFLFFLTWLVNSLISTVYKNIRYRINIDSNFKKI